MIGDHNILWIEYMVSTKFTRSFQCSSLQQWLPFQNLKMVSFQLLDLGFEAVEVSTSDLVDLGATLVELESWHGLDSTFLGKVLALIDIALVEVDFITEFISKLFVLWSDQLAWWAPWSGKVNNHEFIGLFLLLEFCCSLKPGWHFCFWINKN